MSILIPEPELPRDLTADQAVELAYPEELAEAASKLHRGLPVLVECDKDLAPFIYVNLRNRLRALGLKCLYLDGRANPQQQQQPGGMECGLIGTMIQQLRDAVRGAVEKRVLVLPHLDLLTTSSLGLTSEAREVIPLLYENPELVWLGFKDPSFPIPRVIEHLFPHRLGLLGVPRQRLRYLVTQKEARKLGRQFNPWLLYKYVSGVNAIRLRKLLSTLEGEDYPTTTSHILRQLRQATLGATLEIPNIDLEKDIGGYAKVKERLRSDILDVLAYKDTVIDPHEVRALEELIPKGIIFWGPPGTGKTLFAKALASAIGAAITIVSGPELKSKWVGESEENLRHIFRQARQSAPALIVFDELDAFASARGTYTGSGVEHSMVNQLLTEMDGFHKEELVFVIGTTNFVEILDPALLRPGRFEFHLHIPYPDGDDRRAILRIYDEKMKLHMTPEALDYAVKRTAWTVPGAAAGTHFSGDHLNALCRALARHRLRLRRPDSSASSNGQQEPLPTRPEDVERVLTEWIERPTMTSIEEKVLATHEAGHAVVALFCPNAPPIERITIVSDMQWAFGYVRYDDPAHKYIQTRNFFLDLICVAFGGREAERLLLDDLSLGAVSDLQHATAIARELVEVHGLGDDENIGSVRYRSDNDESRRHDQLSQAQLEAIDRRVRAITREQQERAAKILRENRALLETLRDLLLEKKMVEARTLRELLSP